MYIVLVSKIIKFHYLNIIHFACSLLPLLSFLEYNKEDNNDRLEFICSVDIDGEDVPESWDGAIQLLKINFANSMIIRRALPEILHCKVTIVTVYGVRLHLLYYL